LSIVALCEDGRQESSSFIAGLNFLDPHIPTDPNGQVESINIDEKTIVHETGSSNSFDRAAFILTSNFGGPGVFKNLVIVSNESGSMKIIDIKQVAASTISVDMTDHGPGDCHCCPSHQKIKTYTIVNRKITES